MLSTRSPHRPCCIKIFLGVVFAVWFVHPMMITGQSQLSIYKTPDDATFSRLLAAAQTSGSARVIVGLRAQFLPEGALSEIESFQQRHDIKSAQARFIAGMSTAKIGSIKQFDFIPFVALEADAAALQQIAGNPDVTSIEEDIIGEPALAESTPIVGANAAWASGYTGAGQTVAIVDSGVDKYHTFLAGRVISEACYSSNVVNQSTSVCPGGVTQSTDPDSGLHCPTSVEGCAHGTNVAGIAAGKGATMSGVAKDANIIAIQIFSRFDNASTCGSSTPCARYYTSDLIKGLERVRALKDTIPNIAAVNLSLQTGQQFGSNCDVSHAATKSAIDNLRSVNIATVICAGNYAFTNALTAPACISTSISVGSVDDGSLGTALNVVSNFSDSSPLLHLLAPGRWINSSIPGNLFQNYSGTSMAAPHVAGAYAILRQRNPAASVSKILMALSSTGQPITDSRNGLTKPRIYIPSALRALAPPYDFDGDGRSDPGVFSRSETTWHLNRSTAGFGDVQWGLTNDTVVAADYTGDGRADVGVFRDGAWWVLDLSNNQHLGISWGLPGDKPVAADYDGDGKADAAVFRNGAWWILYSAGGSVGITWGLPGDVPVPADYDGDGRADIAVFRDGAWWILYATGGHVGITWGLPGDKPVPADYDGDGKADVAVFRDGAWWLLNSSTGPVGVSWGLAGDTPVPADYDGDTRTDFGVFRGGEWWILNSSGGHSAMLWGGPSDTAVPALPY